MSVDTNVRGLSELTLYFSYPYKVGLLFFNISLYESKTLLKAIFKKCLRTRILEGPIFCPFSRVVPLKYL